MGSEKGTGVRSSASPLSLAAIRTSDGSSHVPSFNNNHFEGLVNKRDLIIGDHKQNNFKNWSKSVKLLGSMLNPPLPLHFKLLLQVQAKVYCI
jgi:hypothetical protein